MGVFIKSKGTSADQREEARCLRVTDAFTTLLLQSHMLLHQPKRCCWYLFRPYNLLPIHS